MRVLISYLLGAAVAAALAVRDMTNPASKAAMIAYAKQPWHGVYTSVHESLVVGVVFGTLAAGTVFYVLSRLVIRRARLCLAPSRACSRC